MNRTLVWFKDPFLNLSDLLEGILCSNITKDEFTLALLNDYDRRDIPRLNSAAEPQRRCRDKGDKTVERSSTMALNGVDSLSALDLVLFSSFRWVLYIWVFLCLYLKVT